MKLKTSKYKYILFVALGLFSFGHAHAAILYSQAANQDVFAGQTFVVDWYVDSENKSLNVVDLGLGYSTDTLEVVEASAGNSLINLWIKNPTFDNAAGRLSLTGGVANGILSDKIPIFRTVFRAKAAGSAYIKLDPGSEILLNDGAGTSELLKFRDEAFNIYPANFKPLEITSSTHPDQNGWYQNPNVILSFVPKPGFDYSASFSSNPEIIPDNAAKPVPDKFAYDNLPDGIYYFKVNQKQGSGNWQEAGVYRVQIDQTPPEDFTPVAGSEAGKNFVSFSTLDKMSGISHYKVEAGLFYGRETADSRIILPKFVIGKKITVTAYDLAGNQKRETINYDGGMSLAVFWGLLAALLVLIGSLIYFGTNFLKRFRKQINENKIEDEKAN